MKDNRKKFLKDVIHGEINIEHAWANEIIATREFSRLNKIKQLGLTYLTFPSATHTRFAHSLGVYAIINRIISELKSKNSEIKKISNDQFNELLAAALLHDIGHGPHSHAFEHYTKIEHEKYSKQIILDENTKINKILKKYKINVQKVVDILEHKHPIAWFNELISSQIDADRMDYLARDSHHSGASYGTLDIGIIIKRIMVINNSIVFDDRAITSIENLLLARYYMFTQVYQKPKTIAYEDLIKQILFRSKVLYKENTLIDRYKMVSLYEPWYKDENWTSEQYLATNDENFSTFIDSLRFEQDEYLKETFKKIDEFKKRDYKVIDYTPEKYENILNKLKLKTKYPEIYISKVKIRTKKIYKTNEEIIYVLDENDNKIKSVEKKSFILQKISKQPKTQEIIVYNSTKIE